MRIDDLIMVSIDDHEVEPPDRFARHAPEKCADQAPPVVVGENGVDQWVYRGRRRATTRRRWAALDAERHPFAGGDR